MQSQTSLALLAALLTAVMAPTALAAHQEGNNEQVLFSACQVPGAMTVHVSSDPAGANLHVDGAPVGQTPAKLCLAAGKHTIRLSEEGRLDWTREVETLPGSEVLLQGVLERGRSGEEIERYYKKSSAIVWALKQLEDDDSCERAKRDYERKYGRLTPTVDYVIETTYRELMGTCDSNDPPRAAREKARRYLLD